MSTSSSRTITHVRRTSAPRVSLLSRAHLDLQEKHLTSTSGAEQIISAIKSRKNVTKLFLGYNPLGDDGTQMLFRYLCSEAGRRYRIADIIMSGCDIGNKGLEAIAEYLTGNESLRELYLQHNSFQGNVEIALKLSTAINASKLERFSIAQNEHLTDTFFIPFISSLNSATLRELQVTIIGLSRLSVPALSEFLASPRCYALEILKCNANSLGARAVRKLVTNLRPTNFTLLKFEVYANAIPGESEEEEGEEGGGGDGGRREESVEEARAKWAACEQELKKLLVRNELLRRTVHGEALALFTYARTLLCFSARRQASEMAQVQVRSGSIGVGHTPSTLSQEASSDRQQINTTSGTSTASSRPFFPFRSLPTELQHYTLALLAPSLSASQRARIFAFATDPNTLQPLLPSLRPSWANSNSKGCIPDPASLPFGSSGPSGSTPGAVGGGSPVNGFVIGSGIGLGSTSPISDPGLLDSPQTQTQSPSPSKSTPGSLPSPTSSPDLIPFASSSTPLTFSSPPRNSNPNADPNCQLDLRTLSSRQLSNLNLELYRPSASMCAGGKCMGTGGSVLCHRVETRMRWLAEVGCGRFDPEGFGFHFDRGAGMGRRDRDRERKVLELIGGDVDVGKSVMVPLC